MHGRLGPVEPDGVARGLAKLLPRLRCEQRQRQSVSGLCVPLPICTRTLCRRALPLDEVYAGDDVPPLVAPAQLDAAPVFPVQVRKVVRLEELVAELGERYPVVRVEPRAYTGVSKERGLLV